MSSGPRSDSATTFSLKLLRTKMRSRQKMEESGVVPQKYTYFYRKIFILFLHNSITLRMALYGHADTSRSENDSFSIQTSRIGEKAGSHAFC